jgi:LmbE family N-acetylglucosaminyl deacetylase
MRRVVVLSPHLDDGVLSIGAFVHRQCRSGVRVEILTVLANDPTREENDPSPWDRRCGFASAGAAASARRQEDRRACAALGATPVWLPYGDHAYPRGGSDAQIWSGIQRTSRDADLVLVPGFPLSHPDHRWLAELVLARRQELDGRLALYAEQPYAAGQLLDHPSDAGATPAQIARDTVRFLRVQLVERPPLRPRHGTKEPLPGVAWRVVRSGAADQAAKVRAVVRYRSQLVPLGPRTLIGAWLYELVHRGETVAWP